MTILIMTILITTILIMTILITTILIMIILITTLLIMNLLITLNTSHIIYKDITSNINKGSIQGILKGAVSLYH
jgi:hypothetical protein